MKYLFFPLLAAALASTSAQAQVTLTNSIFPQANDIYTYSLATTDDNGTVTAPSAQAQVWDFRNLNTATVLYDTIKAASQGINAADYPAADIIQPLIPGMGGTAYIDVTSNAMTRIGAGLEIMTFAFTAPYSNSHILQQAPLTMNHSINDTYAVSYAEDVDNVPMLQQLIDQYAGSLGISPDSVRISIAGTRNAKVDAFGTVKLYSGDYEVLRQRVEDKLTVKIEAKVGVGAFGFWMDVTTLLLSQLPTAIPTSYTTIYYDYLTNNYGHFVVRQEMSEDGATLNNVYFKGQNSVGVSAVELTPVAIYPNPTQGRIQLDMQALAAEAHTVQIIALDGRLVQSHSQIFGGQTQELNLQGVAASGVYICRILNAQHAIVATEKINILP